MIAMNILDSVDNLLEVKLGLIFGYSLALNVIEELAIVGQLHDDEDIIVGIEHFVEFDDIGMVDTFKYCYFFINHLNILFRY